jgi:hypothetical protein
MKRHWQIRRQFQPTADGARRWDQAYQYLLGSIWIPGSYVISGCEHLNG